MSTKKRYNNFLEMHKGYTGTDYEGGEITRPENMSESDWAVYNNLYDAYQQEQGYKQAQATELEMKKKEADINRDKVMSLYDARRFYMGNDLKAQGLGGSMKANVLTDTRYSNEYRNALTEAANAYSKAEDEVIAKYQGLINDTRAATSTLNNSIYVEEARDENATIVSNISTMLGNPNYTLAEVKEYYEANKGKLNPWQASMVNLDIQNAQRDPNKLGADVQQTYNTPQTLSNGASVIVYDGSSGISNGQITGQSGTYNFKKGGEEYTGENVSILNAIFAKAPQTNYGSGRKFVEYNNDMYVQTSDGKIWKLPRLTRVEELRNTNQANTTANVSGQKHR